MPWWDVLPASVYRRVTTPFVVRTVFDRRFVQPQEIRIEPARRYHRVAPDSTHREMNRVAREIGGSAELGINRKLIDVGRQPGMRVNIFANRIKVADIGKVNPFPEDFGTWWRKQAAGRDELFSASTVRELLEGLFEAQPYGRLKPAEIALINSVVDSISAVRLPTRFSGYSLKTEVMQHPSSRARALFGDPGATASKHYARDAQRKDYVVKAMRQALDKGGDLTAIARAGLKAAIEFTLNYFTAPVTASNVLPFSRRAGVDVQDAELQEQVAARERMKDIYIELGGVLRPAIAGETPAQALVRPWAGPPQDDAFVAEPPSPGRLRLAQAGLPAQVNVLDEAPPSPRRLQKPAPEEPEPLVLV